MAKKPTPVQREPANLDLARIQRAIPRLQKRIAELEAFNPANLQQRSAPEVVALRASLEGTLADVFGHNSIEYHRYRGAALLDSGPISLSAGWGRGPGPDLRFRGHLEESKQRSIALLEQAISDLEERAAELDEQPGAFTETMPDGVPSDLPRRVFIAHGHDEASREMVARFLEKIGFEAIILHELPNKGRALITKFGEEAAGIGFAVILMTPDDFGGKASEPPKPRARQNVIFELGFFIGALGPRRVAAIVADDVELPSDYEGVVYIPYVADWKMKLAKELQAAGFAIDWNKAMR
jgi:predicted nucleotide-binding protein